MDYQNKSYGLDILTFIFWNTKLIDAWADAVLTIQITVDTDASQQVNVVEIESVAKIAEAPVEEVEELLAPVEEGPVEQEESETSTVMEDYYWEPSLAVFPQKFLDIDPSIKETAAARDLEAPSNKYDHNFFKQNH